MEEEIQRIVAYLDGEMSPDQQSDFDKELDQRPELKELLERELALRILLKKEEEQELLKAFSQKYQELKSSGKLPEVPVELEKESESKVVPMTRWFVRIGLALAAAIALFFLLRGISQEPSMEPTQIFASNYISPEFDEVKSSMDSDSLWKKTVFALRNNSYDSARKYIHELLLDSSFADNSRAYLYLGHLEMEQENYEAAIEAYSKVDVEIQTAEWYSMLAYLALNKKNEAIKLLNRLQDYDYYKKKATQIKKNLSIP
ncbi:MAG: hypothetical protein MRZ79_03515 [Bacteroidia bacterium]|nr:hypothetical protein [Bacteroidia bacterium]